MKIIVCIKQVPQTEKIKINPATNTLLREGVDSIVNPFDEFAVEEAIRIREKFGGEVNVVSMGPPQAEEAINTCLAMGVDEGYLLSDPCLVGSDTWATSFALSGMIRKIGFNLIICGQETIDSSTGQVGPELAEFLGIPQVTFANKIDFFNKNEKMYIRVKRETDVGYQIIESSLPALITVTKGINNPRKPQTQKLYPASSIIRLDASYLECDRRKLGADGSPTQVLKISTVEHKKRQNIMIDSSLPARERLEQLITGGIKKRADSMKVHDTGAEAAKKIASFISNIYSN